MQGHRGGWVQVSPEEGLLFQKQSEVDIQVMSADHHRAGPKQVGQEWGAKAEFLGEKPQHSFPEVEKRDP